MIAAKSIGLVVILLFAREPGYSQANESDINLYRWKGKKTAYEKGFIVLKSGRKLEGSISANGDFSTIFYKDASGKESEFPAKSLKSFGLALAKVINETPDEYYGWKPVAVYTGEKPSGVEWSKPLPGYILLRTSEKLAGEVQFKRTEGSVSGANLRRPSGWVEYKMYDVATFGLSLTIDQLTQGGKVMFAEKERNFHPGHVVTLDGKKVTGRLAYMKLDASAGYYGVYVASAPDQPAALYKTSELNEIKQQFPGEIEAYVPENESTLKVQAIEGLARNGYIVTRAGEKKEGLITPKTESALWFFKEVSFKDDQGIETLYNAVNPLDHFVQNGDKGEVKFTFYDGVFNQVIHDGEPYMYFRNPRPTAKNELVKGLSATVGDTINLYKKEYIFLNRKTRRVVVVHNGNYASASRDFLMNCASFYSLDKKKQTWLTKMDNAREALQFMNDCK